jgi:hypothetical protein
MSTRHRCSTGCLITVLSLSCGLNNYIKRLTRQCSQQQQIYQLHMMPMRKILPEYHSTLKSPQPLSTPGLLKKCTAH